MGKDLLNKVNEGHSASEHGFSLIVDSNIAITRAGLIKALEQLEYEVLEEVPILAKRVARDGGKTGTSANVLEYTTRLQVGLKSISPYSTKAYFDYTVQHPMLGKSDCRTLEREAEALCALIRQSKELAHCPACGQEAISDSRFCRHCGHSMAPRELAEVELMRLTAQSTAAFEFIRFGVIGVGIALLCLLALQFPGLAPKLIKFLKILGILNSLGWVLLLHGARKLFQAINAEKRSTDARLREAPISKTLSNATKRAAYIPRYTPGDLYKTGELALPAASSPPSITERTTNLLDKQPEALPLRRPEPPYNG
jgi:hypothetical protein